MPQKNLNGETMGNSDNSNSGDDDYETYLGYNKYNVVSALQKSIRRSDDISAAWWARVLYRGGEKNWLWDRLEIIAVEDLPAHSQLLSYVKDLRDTSFSQKPWDAQRTAMAAAITLARYGTEDWEEAGKSRECDELNNLFKNLEQADEITRDFKPPIPDEAFDCHTYDGKKMGRGGEHFVKQSSSINHATSRGKAISEFCIQWTASDRDVGLDADDVDEALREKELTAPVDEWIADKIFKPMQEQGEL